MQLGSRQRVLSRGLAGVVWMVLATTSSWGWQDTLQTQKGRQVMAAESAPLELTVSARGASRFFPEQDAMFDIRLRNTGGTAIKVRQLSGGRFTPRLTVFDADGRKRFEVTPHDAEEHMNLEMGEPGPEKPQLVQLAPGQDNATSVSLWIYTHPLPKGDYFLQVTHEWQPESHEIIESNRLAFSVLDAKVVSMGWSYADPERLASTLAWLASPVGGGNPTLLIRQSASGLHSSAQTSGLAAGIFGERSRLSVSQKAANGKEKDYGWTAVIRGHSVEMIRSSWAGVRWRSGEIGLPVTDVTPIPRFPDRSYGVFMAVGLGMNGVPGLTGFVAGRQPAVIAPPQPTNKPPKAVPMPEAKITPWMIPLKSKPVLSACAFAHEGPISVLLVTAGQMDSISRIDIDEEGKVKTGERVIRSTQDRVLAVVADQGIRGVPGFWLLEQDRVRENRLALVHLPLQGEPSVRQLGEVQGWPIGKDNRPLRAAEVAFDISFQGFPMFAMVDESGDVAAGNLEGSKIVKLAGEEPGKFHHPSIGALRDGTTFSFFTTDGKLMHWDGR